MSCRHRNTEPWPYEDRLRGVEVMRARCCACREIVGMEPTSDRPVVVQIELRAAEIAQGIDARWHLLGHGEYHGYIDAQGDWDCLLPKAHERAWWAGWIARQIIECEPESYVEAGP